MKYSSVIENKLQNDFNQYYKLFFFFNIPTKHIRNLYHIE